MTSEQDTIFALSSGSLPSGVAVLRLSGSACQLILTSLGVSKITARKMHLRQFFDPLTLDILDEGLVCFFPAPYSFTGEDCVELHVHGGKAVVARFLEVLGNFENVRMAEAGDFTRRAFENGKLDLTEIEGLGDLIAAETEFQRRQAVQQAGGRFRLKLERWRSELLQCRAFLEAEFDFSDEDDVPDTMRDYILSKVTGLIDELDREFSSGSKGEIIRDGFRVALMGAPNSGKSSLLNALAGRNIAIVTNIAGTTRDVIECKVDIGGMPVVLFDTAGIRFTDDVVEIEGIRRAREVGALADLVLWLIASDELGSLPETDLPNVVFVFSKDDLAADISDDDAIAGLSFNVISPDGIDRLLAFLETEVRLIADSSNEALITRERHRIELLNVLFSLQKVGYLLDANSVLAGEELRIACDAIGRLTGAVGVEDLLDVIFSQFCIGK